MNNKKIIILFIISIVFFFIAYFGFSLNWLISIFTCISANAFYIALYSLLKKKLNNDVKNLTDIIIIIINIFFLVLSFLDFSINLEFSAWIIIPVGVNALFSLLSKFFTDETNNN